MTMKGSTYSMHNPVRFNSVQQIAAHVGGMTRALVRHYPINWSFHWRGICRAFLCEGLISAKDAKRNGAEAR
jgi:hypothetical protein